MQRKITDGMTNIIKASMLSQKKLYIYEIEMRNERVRKYWKQLHYKNNNRNKEKLKTF